ncbi:MAG: alpha/beta hydrolase [Clostridia bacterium]|nr:alpha/beta hydrolase [Clostridia bacterium]
MSYTIDEKLYVSIGGEQQNIRIRTTDENLPVLLFIHGGPGVCDRHWVLKYQSDLAKVCTMVCWDQRGAGLSYSKKTPASSMTVERCVEDAHELLIYLKNRFKKSKIYIVGHSWGSLLGSLTAYKYPEDVAVYIGMGQFIDGAETKSFPISLFLTKRQSATTKRP